MWNDAFDTYSYCNKYKFKLDIEMKNRPGGFGEPSSAGTS